MDSKYYLFLFFLFLAALTINAIFESNTTTSINSTIYHEPSPEGQIVSSLWRQYDNCGGECPFFIYDYKAQAPLSNYTIELTPEESKLFTLRLPHIHYNAQICYNVFKEGRPEYVYRSSILREVRLMGITSDSIIPFTGEKGPLKYHECFDMVEPITNTLNFYVTAAANKPEDGILSIVLCSRDPVGNRSDYCEQLLLNVSYPHEKNLNLTMSELELLYVNHTLRDYPGKYIIRIKLPTLYANEVENIWFSGVKPTNYISSIEESRYYFLLDKIVPGDNQLIIDWLDNTTLNQGQLKKINVSMGITSDAQMVI